MSPSRYDLSGKENLGSHIDIQSGGSVQRRGSFPEQGNAIYQQENTNVVPINVIKYPTDLQIEDNSQSRGYTEGLEQRNSRFAAKKSPEFVLYTYSTQERDNFPNKIIKSFTFAR